MFEKRILVIEDDMDAANVLEAYLMRDKFQVAIASDGLRGLELAAQWQPHLILLDVMLPGLNGNDVLVALRRKGNVPVIMVTAMGDDIDKIGALKYGADDYIVKPYNPREVVARVHAVLRRSQANPTVPDKLCYQSLMLDLSAFNATVLNASGKHELIDLTPTEFNLLVTLLKAPTKAFSRQELLETCLPDSDALERVVDTHIYNLRKKLEEFGLTGILLTVRSFGYRFR